MGQGRGSANRTLVLGLAALIVMAIAQPTLAAMHSCTWSYSMSSFTRGKTFRAGDYIATGTSDRILDNVSTSNSAQKLESLDKYEIIAVGEQPEPLCTIYAGQEYIKKSEEEEATEIMMGVVLIVNPCGEAIILDEDLSTRVDNIDYEMLARSISTHIGSKPCLAKTKILKRKSELEKLDIVGIRRSQRLKRRKILKKCRGVSVY
ncbi:hypothetical protein KSS87_013582 [Heliosperma pusillum]|nr:hypothetical protein KSS87_013582 [Heliosperma pusillum]